VLNLEAPVPRFTAGAGALSSAPRQRAGSVTAPADMLRPWPVLKFQPPVCLHSLPGPL